MSGYNAAFVAALHHDMDSSGDLLKSRAAELVRNREVERLFPGRSALWLQKELSKWRKKLAEDNFNGTLQSLQVYCTLMGSTPNDVLLPPGMYSGPGQVEFLCMDTILSIAETIREKHIIPRQGCALPVLYAPGRMTVVFLFLYPQRRAGKDTVIGRFGLSEPDGYADTDGSDCTGGIHTALDSSLYAADLFHEDWETRLRSAYEKIRGEFEAVCAMTDSPLEDAVNEFYVMMGGWTERHRNSTDLLFSWYPPEMPAKMRAGTLDSLSSTLEQYGRSERER